MEEHLIVSSDEHKVLKKFKDRLQKRHQVVINMPNESSQSDIICTSIVGEKKNIENVKNFLCEKMKPKESITSKKGVVLITLSDSEESTASSDSESKENSVCVVEEHSCVNQNLSFMKKSPMSLDNSICVIEYPENSSTPNTTAVQHYNNRRKRKFEGKKPRRFKRRRWQNNLETEVSSPVEVCEVSSTTEEMSVKRAQPQREKLAAFIPLNNKTKLRGIANKKVDVVLVQEPAETTPRQLRPIVIDGSNVAVDHGKAARCFSVKGIQLAIEWFLKRGHTDVHAFVPKFRRNANPSRPFPTKDAKILDELEKKQLVVFTPSRRVNGKCIASYDDRFIVELASKNGGVIVSNDNYRDLIGESKAFKETIEKRLLMFCFVGDLFMIPSDPLGRDGPSLDEFLSFPPENKT